jgi:hypothetical protein
MKHELGDFALSHEYFDRDKYKYTQKVLKGAVLLHSYFGCICRKNQRGNDAM